MITESYPVLQGSKVRFAILGYGKMGRQHAEIISWKPNATVVAIIEPWDTDTLETQDVPLFRTVEAFLSSSVKADAVILASPNGNHAEQADLLLKAGFHVIVEKPIALSVADTEAMMITAHDHARKLIPVSQNQYSSVVRWLKDTIDSGVLGRIFLVEARAYWNRDSRYYIKNSWKGTRLLDGGPLFTQFYHYIDSLIHLFGPVDLSTLRTKFFDFNHESLTECEDSGLVDFSFDNGEAGMLSYSTSVWNKNLESTLCILAENGSIRIGGQYMDRLEYCHIKDYVPAELVFLNDSNHGTQKNLSNHARFLEQVINSVSGQPAVLPNFLETLHVVRLIEAIYKIRGNHSSSEGSLTKSKSRDDLPPGTL